MEYITVIGKYQFIKVEYVKKIVLDVLCFHLMMISTEVTVSLFKHYYEKLKQSEYLLAC